MAFFIDLVIESTFPQAQNQSDIESTEFSKYLVDIPSAEKLDEGCEKFILFDTTVLALRITVCCLELIYRKRCLRPVFQKTPKGNCSML